MGISSKSRAQNGANPQPDVLADPTAADGTMSATRQLHGTHPRLPHLLPVPQQSQQEVAAACKQAGAAAGIQAEAEAGQCCRLPCCCPRLLSVGRPHGLHAGNHAADCRRRQLEQLGASRQRLQCSQSRA